MNTQTLNKLKQQCIDEIHRAFDIAAKHFPQAKEKLLQAKHSLPIVFNPRLKSTAGRCFYSRWTWEPTKIDLSTSILKLNGQQFVKRTPAHEAAHAISTLIYGQAGGGHGPHWKEIMRLLERDGSRCHNMKTANVRSVYCNCTEHQVKTRIYNAIARGAHYYCKKCKSQLHIKPQTIEKKEEVVAKKATTPKSNKSKADIVREYIASKKQNGSTLEMLLVAEAVVEVMELAGIKTKALTKTYIKNNFDKA